MNVRYLGHSCFLLTSQTGYRVVTDPYAGVGYSLPKNLEADAVTVSHGHFDHNYTDGVRAEVIIADPKGYENGEVKIYGTACYHDEKMGALRGNNIAFIIEMDGLRVCHMGDIGEEASPAILQKLGRVDVLLLPVGGKYTVDALGAKRYADGLSPRVIVPMHYRPLDGSLDITDARSFLDLYSKEEITYQGKKALDITSSTKGVIYMERRE